MVFLPPAGAGALHLLVWAGLMSLAWTALSVPYFAWGAELSTSYAGRSRVVAARETLTVVGTVVALLAQAIIPAWWGGGPASALAGLAVLVGLTLPAAAALAVTAAPEPVDRSVTRLAVREGVVQMLANRPFRRLLGGVLPQRPRQRISGNAVPVLCRRPARRADARRAAAAGLFPVRGGRRAGVAGAGAAHLQASRLVGGDADRLRGVPDRRRLLGPGDVGLFLAVCVITGLTLGADLMLPGALQADVIDVDTAATGRAALRPLSRRLEPRHQGRAWRSRSASPFPCCRGRASIRRSGAASEHGLMALAVLYAAVPVALKLAAIVLMWRFPLDAAEQARLRATIDSRRGA